MINFLEPTAEDESDEVNVVFRSHMPGDCFNVGTTAVTYVFSDAVGNLEQYTFSVIINGIDVFTR